MHELYRDYINYIRSMFDISSFKQHPSYNVILEHVSVDLGHKYYSLLKEECNLNDNTIHEFCIQNDSVGNPLKFNINGILCSPTSLRYLYHACQVINNIHDRDIIEIGGGYGGLCLAIDFLSKLRNVKIKSYTIIDLEEVINVQSIYLNKFSLEYDVTFLSASDYKDKLNSINYFLISNYCVSEIDEILRQEYVRCLFPYVENGFIAWNFIPFDDNMFKNFKTSVEVEKPVTGNYNFFVNFKRA